MKISSRSSRPQSSPLDTARELLGGCCVSCDPASAAECDGASSPASPLVSHPGSLDPSGPLAKHVQAALGQIAGCGPTHDNRVRLLVDGTQSYGAMLDLLQAAGTEVRFENFIFRSDTVGHAFAQTLQARSDDGVDVRVLYDPFGSIMSRRRSIWRRFRRSSVQVRAYNPLRPTLGFFRGGRDHRKLVVQDRRRLVAGGMCLADVWSGNCIRHCTWRDSAVLVEGPAAGEAAAAFDRVWTRAAHRASPRGVRQVSRVQAVGTSEDRDQASKPLSGTVPVRVLAGHRRERLLEKILTRVFDAAEDEILVTNSYFLPTEALLSSLRSASLRGVRVEVLLPANNNHVVAGLASEHLVGPLLDAGVRVWLWLGPMVHAKTVVVDRRWSTVGSSNLDALSLRKNLELDIEIHGSAIGEQLSEIFARDRSGCRPFTAEDRNHRSLLRRGASRLAFAGRRLL